MLDDLAQRVAEHPSCRQSLRYHWPGPHVHHIRGNHMNESSSAQRHSPAGTTATMTSAPTIATPPPPVPSASPHSASACDDSASGQEHEVLLQQGSAQHWQAPPTSTATAADTPVVFIRSREKHRTLCVTVRYGHAASLLRHAARPDALAYLALHQTMKKTQKVHTQLQLLQAHAHMKKLPATNMDYKAVEKTIMNNHNSSATTTDMGASTDSDVFSHICLTLPEGQNNISIVQQHTAPGKSLVAAMNTITTTATNITNTVSANATSTAPPGSVMDLSDTHRFELSQSLCGPGRNTSTNPTRLAAAAGSANVSNTVVPPSVTNGKALKTQETSGTTSCSCCCCSCCTECGIKAAEQQTQRTRFCLYERTPNTDEENSRKNDEYDNFHRDDEALELLSITTTSSCVYGLGLQGLQLLSGESDKSTPIESPREARQAAAHCEKWLCAMKERAHRANGRGLWALCQHCHAHPTAMSGTHSSSPASALYDAILCCPRCSGQEKLDILYGARLPVCLADMQGGNGRIVRKMLMPFTLQPTRRHRKNISTSEQQQQQMSEAVSTQRSGESASAPSRNVSVTKSGLVAQVNAWRDRQKIARIMQWLAQVEDGGVVKTRNVASLVH